MKKTKMALVAGSLAALLLTTPAYAQEQQATMAPEPGETATMDSAHVGVPKDITAEERGYTHVGLYEQLTPDRDADVVLETFALYSYNTANADVAYAFLTGEGGMNAAQAAGVMASLYTESHFEPSAYNGSDSGGTISYGICQWNSGGNNGGRYQMLLDWCAANGYDYKTFEGQLHYINYEITKTWEKQVHNRTDSDGNCFGTAPDSSDGAWIAGYTWSRYYGRGAASGWYTRGDIAREFYAMYAGKATPTPTPVPTSTPTPTANPAKVTAFVTRLYSVCLDRLPDADGLKEWETRLTGRSITGTQAAAGFVFSDEFKAKKYTNEDYVKQLYRAFMGREYDATGLQDWTSRLNGGTSREAVFNGFAQSKEFSAICAEYGITLGTAIAEPTTGSTSRDDITEFVSRMYQVCLDREPDTAGLANWVNALRTGRLNGRGVAYNFVFSKEFTGKNYTDADYVEHLYKAFFGRASDATGKADWTGRLAAGASRGTVFDGFVGSKEFSEICASYGIDRG